MYSTGYLRAERRAVDSHLELTAGCLLKLCAQHLDGLVQPLCWRLAAQVQMTDQQPHLADAKTDEASLPPGISMRKFSR
jgi:hypothetical protein